MGTDVTSGKTTDEATRLLILRLLGETDWPSRQITAYVGCDPSVTAAVARAAAAAWWRHCQREQDRSGWVDVAE